MKFSRKTLFTVLGGLVLISAILTLSTCDLALGDMVNTTRPIITAPEDSETTPGDYIAGENTRIELDVQQPFGLAEVYMEIWFQPIDPENPPEGAEYDESRGLWKMKIPAEYDENKGTWYVDIDTTQMQDGSIYAQVTAIDVSGNATTTTDMVYTVKNTPPQLEMTIPVITGTDYETVHFKNPVSQALPLIYASNNLMGIATDLFGIEAGYPQIMIWPAEDDGAIPAGISLDDDNAELSQAREWGTWRTVLDEKDNALSQDRLKAVMFRWTTKKLINDGDIWRTRIASDGGGFTVYPDDYFPVGRYHFKIRVKDKFGITNIYPYRLDSGLSKEEHPNEYMSVYVAETSNPIITFGEADRYYNASAFSGPLVRTVTIVSKNGVNESNVEALVSTSLSAKFDDPKYASYVERISGDDTGAVYKISIPASEVRQVSGDKSNDNMVLHVRAQDVQGNFTVSSLNFILDIDNSSIEFINPMGLENLPNKTMQETKDGLTSTVKFMGTTTDPSTRVVKMYYALGKTEVAAASNSLDPTDLTGWIDTKLDSPKTDGSPTLAGHPNGGINASWYGTLNNWRWEFNNIRDVYLAGSQAVMPNGNGYLYNDTAHNYGNSNIWHLPIKFKLVDIAGNVSIHTVVVLVDPDRDRPDVIVNSHSQTDPLTVVGGEVRVNGIATDNEVIYDVQIKVTAQYDAQITSNAAGTWVVTANQKGSGAEGWVPVTMIGGGSSVNWYFILNRDDSSLPNGYNTAGLTPPNVDSVRKVKLEVRARDASIYTPNMPKPIHQNHIVEVIDLEFSATVPTITDITIIHDSPSISVPNPPGGDVYNIGATVSGELIIKAKIEDDKGITSIKIRGSESSEFSANLIVDDDPLGTPVSSVYPSSFRPWVVKTVTAPNAPVVYYVYIPLNTNGTSSNYGLWGGRYHNSAGAYSLDIQIIDNTNPMPYMAQTTVALQVDNYYPGSNYSGNLNATGTHYTVSGYAWDTGDSNISVFDVDKIVVYFSRPGGGGEIGGSGASGVMAGSQVNIDGTVSGSTGDWVATQRVKINRRSTDSTTPSEEGSVVTLPMFPVQTPVVAQPGRYATNNAGYVINANGGTLGTTQSFRDMPNKLWSVQVDTTKFADGPLYVNYVVFDKAGNAAFYRTEVYIANKRPRITNVQVGTDIDRNGSIAAPAEYFNYDPEPDSAAFRIRNNRFNVRLNITGGNGQKNYRISHVKPNIVNVAANTIIKGRVYTIADMGGITVDEWINMGVIGGPASNDYTGITFAANNDYTGSNYGGSKPAIVYEYTYGGTANPTSTSATQGLNVDNTYLYGNNIGTTDLTNFVPTTAFTNTNFGGTTSGTVLIPDSPKGSDGIVTTAGKKQRFFMIKVWDTTRTGNPEVDQLADVQVIAVDIDNSDSRPPVVSIKPFYWNSETDNSLYENKRVYGHIELEAHTAAIGAADSTLSANLRDNDPKVSGIVSFRGTSYDSNNIGSFYIRISNHTNTQGTTITQPTTGGNTHYLAATFNGGTSWTTENRLAANGWSFVIEPGSEPDINGHTVNWRLDYDSTFINNNGDAGTNNGRTDNTANLNNIFTIVALDAAQNRSPTTNPNTWVTSMQTTAAAPTEHYRFDIVPYIREVFTPLSQAFKSSPSAFARSAHGWYPVKESAADTERIEIKGFNLRGTAATSYITINGTALTALAEATSSNTYADTFNKDVPSNRYTHVVGRVVSINSGPMLVTINSIPSLNNVNDNNAEYNKEPNNSNNNILTDNRSFYVWNVGSLLTRDATDRSLDYPFLRVSSSGHRFLTYNHGVSTAALVLNNNQASVTSNGTVIENTTNRYLNLTLAADANGLWYLGASNMTAQDYNSFHLHARGIATGNSRTMGQNKTRILSLGLSTGGDYNRVRIPRIHARTTAANNAMVVISYGNNSLTYNDIYFHYGSVNGTGGTTNAFGGNFVAAQTGNTTTNYTNEGTQGGTGAAGLATRQIVTGSATTHRGSQYTAVATLSTTTKLGIPVIAWYDKDMQRLVISYGNQPTNGTSISTTATDDWQGRATVVKEAAGTHVDMAVDGSDNIHLAYYDVFNGGLWYTFIPASGITAYAAGGTNNRAAVSGMKTVKVDTYLSAGTKITINVRQHGTGNFVPYISYFHSSFAETRNSIRVAWPTTTAGVVKF
ncbi:MAG: hypothetical protein FWB95_01110, partial [Treponema sp.]|nr:hypothetical protein [Treponema sp.]